MSQTTQPEDSGEACAHAFDMAARETISAWSKTSLLSMTRAVHVERMEQVLSGARAADVAEFLADLAGPSFAAYAMKSGMDADKVAKMSRIVMGLLCNGLPPATDLKQRADLLLTLHRRCKQWIELGALPADQMGVHAADALSKISSVTGRSPAVRLALIAPFAPAVAVCGVVLRARHAQYPFDHQARAS